MKLTRNLSIVVGILLLLVLAILTASFLGQTARQRQAIQSLTEIGHEAESRHPFPSECTPGYSFDTRGPRAIEDLTGPTYFSQVTGIAFPLSDDQQILESIPHLQRFDNLTRVMFLVVPNQPVIEKLRNTLPGVSLVNDEGLPIP